MPRVSVCISVYNGAATLRETLESAFAQTYRDFEVLVLDDGSSDDSAAIAEKMGARVVRQANAGRGAALARMMELAVGEWIALLDADDVWLPQKLEVQIKSVDETKVDLIHSGGWFEYPDGRQELRSGLQGDPHQAWDHILPHNQIIASSAVFRRSSILEAGNFSPDTWSACDWYGWLVMAPRCQFGYLAEPLVRYRIREGSIANKGFRFQAGKRHVLKDLILPRADELFADNPSAARYKRMISKGIGVAASTMAKFLDAEGKKGEARELHREAIRLSPTVLRVWTRALGSYLRP
jgi:glycosyltransferase involved in cell wall biosynthesis